MGIRAKVISSAAMAVGLAGMISSSFAHLPMNDLHMMRRSKAGVASRAITRWPDASTATAYDKSKDYKGGSVVTSGDFNGVKLYWTNNWWADPGDVPGQFADSGGTSAWGLINSYAYSTGEALKWVGWNSGVTKYELGHTTTWELTAKAVGDWGDGLDKAGPGAYLPSWRDGAEACYSMIHDDIGAMNYETSVKPDIDLMLEGGGKKYERIRDAWGVFVGETDADEWAEMRSMVKMGIEIVNHSYDHTSAAQQWQWFYNGDTLPPTDPSIPIQLMGLVVDTSLSSTKSLAVDVPYIDYVGGDVNNPETLHLNYDVQVSSDYEFVKDSVWHADWDEWEYVYHNKGKIKGSNKGWSDDANASVSMLKLYCVPGWTGSRYKVNIREATKLINANIYDKQDVQDAIAKFPHFKPGKKVEYYVYPYDAYSDATHDSLYADGIIASRGGAKSGTPLPCDFFQPFRIDFDAFFMLDSKATTVFPNNPHQRLSLDGLVDRNVQGQGYMIREFHAVVAIEDEANWNDANLQEKGGWWGGVPTYLLRQHYDHLNDLIDQHKLTVMTPTEAVKYRITANYVDKVNWSATSTGGSLEVTMKSGFDERYYDEISVIIVLDTAVEGVKLTYDSDGSSPRRHAVKMDADGKAWSVSIDPSKGKATLTYAVDPVKTVSVANKIGVAYNGLVGGKVSLRLPAGNFVAQVYDLAGRLVKSEAISNTTAGIVNTGINVNNLASRMFVLSVKKDGASIFNKSVVLTK